MKTKIPIVGLLLTVISMFVACNGQTTESNGSDLEVEETSKVQEEEEIIEEPEKEPDDITELDTGNIEVSWEEAKEYNGQTITITGPVVKHYYSEGWEFTSLTVGQADEGGVAVVIFDQDNQGFPEDMESYYLGKTVKVTGEVSYRNVSDISEIRIVSPDQIEVISDNTKNDIEIEDADSEATQEEEVGEDSLKFSYSNEFPDLWGIIRICDPLIVEFSNIEVHQGRFLLGDNEVQVVGQIKGLESISFTWMPESGVFTMLAGVIQDSKGNIKWEQEGYPIEDAYILQGDLMNFKLINKYDVKVEDGDYLTIIAYIEAGMIEDDLSFEENIDRGVFGFYKSQILIEN